MAMVNPVPIYIAATSQPNIPYNRIMATSFIIGAAIRNENVTPRGTPDSIKPKNNGIAEQEQNGVTIPNVAAIILPVKVCLPSSAFLVRSGVKKVRIIPTRKIMRVSKSKTLGNS
jgi:hypothetical protein